MATMEIKVNLEDEEGMRQAKEMLSRYIDGNSGRACQNDDPCIGKTINTLMADSGLPDEVLNAPPRADCSGKEAELDSAGEAWDPKKHSAGKTKLDDGTWRRKRAIKAKAKDEKPIPAPPPPGTGLAPEEVTYKNMMDILKGKGLTLAQMNELAAQVGVASIALLIAEPGLIPAVLALADAYDN